jgi:hypothetical protein
MAENPSFQEFADTLLAAWSEDLPVGDTVSSPRIAAAKACYVAAIEYPRKRGTVLVAADDAADARSCVQYLVSFFSDQEQLKPLLKTQKGDTFELAGGKRITVTTDRTRRPGSLLACIRLTSATTEAVSPRDVARALFLAAREQPECAAQIESLLGLEPGWFADCRELHRQRMQAWKCVDLGVEPAAPPTSVPVVPREQPQDDGYYSESWELQRMAREEMKGRECRPVIVHRVRPRR